MKRLEQDTQIAVCEHLRLRAEPRVFWFHAMNAGKRSLFVGKKLRDAGLVSGVPDLIILKDGRMYCLELKAPKGKLSPSQIITMDRLQHCGAQVAVAKSIDEALVTLECWGILKRSVSHRVPETIGAREAS